MLSKYIATAMLGTALMAGPAMSQTPSPSTSSPAPAAKSDSAPAAVNPAFKDKWRASKLIGLDIYNDQSEKLGDINELILDKDGKIAAVVIGVGGFLGMGEHDIAVTLDKLKFVEEPMKTATTTTTTSPTSSTTGAASNSGMAKSSTTTTTTYDWVPDHAIMSGTKEQLKALPQFRYADYN
jgi:sporulation protein YlmC with PRC-barrel domain